MAPRRTIVALVWGNETPSSSSRPRGKRGVQSCTYLDGFTTLLELAEVRRLESRDDDRFHDAIHALVAAAANAAAQTDGLSSKVLKGILDDDKLIEAKERTSAETARWQAAPPVFTKDGKIAVVTIDSGYQSESSVILLTRMSRLKGVLTLVRPRSLARQFIR